MTMVVLVVAAAFMCGIRLLQTQLVDGEKYLPVNTDGNSTFEIPVAALDTALAVTADTVAMSTPHEIDYTLTFDSATLAAAE